MGISIGSILKKAVGAITNPVGAAIGLLSDVAGTIRSDSVVDVIQALSGNTDSLNPEEKAAVKRITQAHELSVEQGWQSFMIDHEGKAKDMPKFVQILRALVRPSLSWLIPGFAGWVSWYQMTRITFLTDIQAQLLAQINNKLWIATFMVLGFWFGEKLLTRTGIMSAFKGKG